MKDSDEGFCSTCYRASIKRLCTGYTYTAGKQIRQVPPLPAGLARDVRQAAAAVLAKRASTCYTHQAAA